jgi:hypothetical protein
MGNVNVDGAIFDGAELPDDVEAQLRDAGLIDD